MGKLTSGPMLWVPVATMRDVSGNENHLTQPAHAHRPFKEWSPSDIPGLLYHYDGSDGGVVWFNGRPVNGQPLDLGLAHQPVKTKYGFKARMLSFVSWLRKRNPHRRPCPPVEDR